ncbi:PLDc N-terminal domain-containing protein [Candidatus Dojkabacteria bacterium]|uniref:PLDc N-terminal domain-containing protein n=1 Tax=Candidatus Dojkabacteria bacterium TaxID=2099670 RepID=A0A955L8J8_9BACT|nr:PLDc N-terminal domain-containing protein [Candidatus Dojkabacteria bacterium]
MIASFVLWVIVLIDAVQREFESDNDRLVWVLIILFTGWIGAAIYYLKFMKKSSK